MSLFNFDFRNTRLVLAGALLALGAAGATAGCNSGDVSTLTSFCGVLAQADCSGPAVQACYAANEQTLQTDVDTCISLRSQISICNPGNLPYHPEFAGSCIQAHQDAFAGAQIPIEAFNAMNEACLPTFNNGGVQGASCREDSDCEVGQNLRCLVRVGGRGTCQIPSPTPPGQDCRNPTAQCGEGQFCDSGFHCVAQPTKGEKCGAGQPCATGSHCTDSACIANFADQSPCTVDQECQGGFCLAVTGSGRRCAAAFTLAFGSSTCHGFTR